MWNAPQIVVTSQLVFRYIFKNASKDKGVHGVKTSMSLLKKQAEGVLYPPSSRIKHCLPPCRLDRLHHIRSQITNH
ncbi:hypothetical protein Scep_030797 [Stephania cephalantha]|uniref:Uncharacterized protein n=1 Tax=Stephania cephalantha TaxID=152367 RepID=A0AAP0E0G6_9MAGN